MSHLRNAISSEVRGGYCNMYYSTVRFSNFLHSKLLQCYSQSSQYSTRKLLKESSEYTSVSVLMGYSNVQGLIEQDNLYTLSNVDASGAMENFDFTRIQDKFPCIVLGDSSPIELYNDGTHCLERMNTLLPKCYNDYFSHPMESLEPLQFIEPHDLDILTAPISNATACPIDIAATNLDSEIHTDNLASVTAGCYSHQTNGDGQNTLIYSAVECMNSIDIYLETDKFLEKTIRELPNTTSRQCRLLEDSGIHTVRKLLHHFPRTYADFQNVHDEIEDGQYLICPGIVRSSRGIRAGSSFSFLEVIVCCELSNMESTSKRDDDVFSLDKKKMIYLHLKKYFRGTRFTYQPFLISLQSKYKEGDRVCVSGKVKKMRLADHFEIREFNVDKLQEPEEKFADIDKKPYPIYSSKGGLKPSFLKDIISGTIKILPKNIDPIPSEIVKEFKLLDLYDAYNGIHNPRNLAEADLARIRLIFDEFFYLQLGKLYQMLDALGTRIEKEQLLDKYINHKLFSIPKDDWTPVAKKLLNSLPYSLTPSQLNAVSEIIYDLKRPVPMNRLLQGDVGCGKTVVAFLACMEVIGSGFQAAFMVPTELLALQHYDHLLHLLESFGQDDCKPSVALLTGSTPTKQSRIILKGLQMGDISMVIGTHSLIADKVEFSALRIAVVDEQHRFGVIQRGRFNSKLYSSSASLRPSMDVSSKDNGSSMAPHVLAMSATPIPRTLALALYGDMSLTQITELPPGRKPIETFVLEGNESGFEHVFKMMLNELIGGGRIYLVYPIIEESEQLPQLRAAKAEFEVISKRFESYQCGLLHGRMKSEDKDEALKKFRSGETQILLATQVIEIGVDVPDASMMVVVNAERFGIAQLHQLRGRVGRGERKSKCVFLSSTSETLGRLKVLEKSCDGFYLANADLLLRGPGNLLGKKQSGHLPEFPIARLEIDGNILQEAHLAALKVLAASHDLEKFPSLKAELSMHQPLCVLGD